ncbi:hypothetical protein TNCV_1738301 [Trichonephila clavipes]|nr:hypothetical protein TNCV_1738301 [Trichonephila clavipes]
MEVLFEKGASSLAQRVRVAARGLLATDLVILNYGQGTRTAPELTSPSSNYHTTPSGGRFSLGPSARRVLSGTRLQLMTRRPRIHNLDHRLSRPHHSVKEVFVEN